MAYTQPTPDDLRRNAWHLKSVPDDDLTSIIEDAWVLYINGYLSDHPELEPRLQVLHKLLAQHWATINKRRADEEHLPSMSKKLEVPKSEALGQTEYGQMAAKAAKDMGLDLGDDPAATKRANVVIFDYADKR